MKQSTLHVAIIMDGNGRWATERGLPRTEGHRRGAKAVEHVIERAPRLEIDVLTLFAFSSDNWLRPVDEVTFLMSLFEKLLAREAQRCRQNGIRLNVVGRRDRLPRSLAAAIERAEQRTAHGDRILVRLAVDYSARDVIERAARSLVPGEEFAGALARAMNAVTTVPRLDLLIRTGREKRLSDFLLWEAAYAELFFSDQMWPDFGGDDLERGLAWFRERQRRFGRIAPATSLGEVSHG